MNKNKNNPYWPWDDLSARFNTHKDENLIHPDAAVNLYLGWPVFFDLIQSQQNFLNSKKLNILDFGCGAGLFCKKVSNKRHNVVGIDNSTEMLKEAKKNLPSTIQLYKGDHTSKLFNTTFKSKFDVITSMHVLDWIKDIKTAITNLHKALKKDGILIFAVFPQEHIKDSLKIKDLFENFDSSENPKKGYANFDGISVPVYVKRSSYYDNLCKKLGFEKVLEYYPPYPKKFIEDFNWQASMYPEMVILAYRKIK